MAKGDRPDLKVVGKRKKDAPAELPEYVDIGAFWRGFTDDGQPRVSGKWDGKGVGLVVLDRDGNQVKVRPEHYWLNVQEKREDAPQQPRKPAPQRPAKPVASNDGYDANEAEAEAMASQFDDIPF